MISAEHGTVKLEELKKVHFIGIGGVGMSGVSRLLHARGVRVTGSDHNETPVVQSLRDEGITVYPQRHESNVADADAVVVSTATRKDNPELIAARAAGIAILHRSEALRLAMDDRVSVAVAGTHGKTTTTSMIAVGLEQAGFSPSYVIGGTLAGSNRNAHLGSSRIVVVEADESDGSFLSYSPNIGIITNVEPDHLDYYGSVEAVVNAFDQFCDRIAPAHRIDNPGVSDEPHEGLAIICADDPQALAVAQRAKARGIHVLTYGRSDEADVRVVLESSDSGVRFSIHLASGEQVPVELHVPGAHNALNGTAAFLAMKELGVESEQAAIALGEFIGAHRRFEKKADVRGIRVFDDYGHHPTEVRAAIDTAQSVAGDGRVFVVFQPHLYSRTAIFAKEFAEVLTAADRAYVLPIYGGREEFDPSVTSAAITDNVDSGRGEVVRAFEGDWHDVAVALVSELRPGDVVLTQGAGDVTSFSGVLVPLLEKAEQER